MYTLFYIHDPMCSWCWGFAPCWEQLQQQLPDAVEVRYLLGGLAPDSDQPMEASMQRFLQQTWRKIEQQIPSRRFNHRFWELNQPRRSTYPACRAVIAARSIAPEKECAMVEAIQQGYYRRALNPSEERVLVQLAGELDLDQARFREQLHAEEVEAELQQEIVQSRGLGADSFPSLVLQLQKQSPIPIAVDYHDPQPMLETIESVVNR